MPFLSTVMIEPACVMRMMSASSPPRIWNGWATGLRTVMLGMKLAVTLFDSSLSAICRPVWPAT